MCRVPRPLSAGHVADRTKSDERFDQSTGPRPLTAGLASDAGAVPPTVGSVTLAGVTLIAGSVAHRSAQSPAGPCAPPRVSGGRPGPRAGFLGPRGPASWPVGASAAAVRGGFVVAWPGLPLSPKTSPWGERGPNRTAGQRPGTRGSGTPRTRQRGATATDRETGDRSPAGAERGKTGPAGGAGQRAPAPPKARAGAEGPAGGLALQAGQIWGARLVRHRLTLD